LPPPPPSPPPLPPLTDAAFSDAILACLGVDPKYGNCPDLEYGGTITEWFAQDVTNFASAFKGASQFIGNISKGTPRQQHLCIICFIKLLRSTKTLGIGTQRK